MAHELNQPLAAILSNAQSAIKLMQRGFTFHLALPAVDAAIRRKTGPEKREFPCRNFISFRFASGLM
jgi:hypothetical protein